ncbi:MAG: MFS transporter, partial [Eggerthellaceae bacterium]|nr:MFS transporter [Eggerthellaceae bacterium]
METANKKTGLIIVVAAYAAFLATFNETLLNVAFSSIMVDFSIPVSTVQWLATAYMLGVAVFIPVAAFAYQTIKPQTLFILTMLLLVIASCVGALAVSFPMLLVARVFQAIGSGLLIPTGMNITLDVTPRDKLGKYMGIMAAMTTIGVSSSVIISGILRCFVGW